MIKNSGGVRQLFILFVYAAGEKGKVSIKDGNTERKLDCNPMQLQIITISCTLIHLGSHRVKSVINVQSAYDVIIK